MTELTFRERPAAGDPAGLLVLHHGRGTDENDLLPLSDVLDPERRLHVVTPRGPLTLPGWPGHHWYVVPRVGYPDPDTFRAAFASLAELDDELWRRTGLGPEQTVLGGFSMGSVMSYSLGLAGSRPAPAGILAFSGFVPVVEGWSASLEDRQGNTGFHRPRPQRSDHGRRLRPPGARAAGAGWAGGRVPRVGRRPPHRPGAASRCGRVAGSDAERGAAGRTLSPERPAER
jgi:phospholipase/carboxylesterase